MDGGVPRIEFVALLTAICWATGSFVGKNAMKSAQISPLTGITVRTAVALMVLLALMLAFGRRFDVELFNEIRRAWDNDRNALMMIVFFEGVLAGATGMALYYASISGGDLSLVMPLAFASPLWGTLLALWGKDEVLTLERGVGITLMLVGVFAITSSFDLLFSSGNELLRWRVEYLALFTGICWGVGSYFGKKGMKRTSISPLTGITIRAFIALPVLLLFCLIAGDLMDTNLVCELNHGIRNNPMDIMLIAIFEGVLAGSIGMALFYLAIKKGDLSLVLPLAFSSPLWGTMLAILLGGETLTFNRAIGITFTFAGVVAITSNWLPLPRRTPRSRNGGHNGP